MVILRGQINSLKMVAHAKSLIYHNVVLRNLPVKTASPIELICIIVCPYAAQFASQTANANVVSVSKLA